MSKKISELDETTELYDGCCMPIVTEGETKRVLFGTIKNALLNLIPSWARQSTKPTYTYDEIQNKPTIPTKTSDLENDRLYATESYVSNAIAEAQLGGSGGTIDLSGYATKDDLNLKANTTDIPTKTSQLTNDSNYVASTVVTAFWTGSQTQYDALGSYSNTTLYLITE